MKYLSSFSEPNDAVSDPHVSKTSEAMLAWFSSADHTTLVQCAKGRYNSIIYRKYNVVKRFASSRFLQILSRVNLYSTPSGANPAKSQAVSI